MTVDPGGLPPVTPPGPRPSTAWGLLRTCLGVLAGVFTLAMLSAAVLPALVGWSPVVIVTGSMAPSLHAGDVIVLAPPPAVIADGTVVRFRASAGEDTLVHRVAGRTADGRLVTRGDAGAADDRLIDPDDVTGVARLRIPALGLAPLALARAADVGIRAVGIAGLLAAAALAGPAVTRAVRRRRLTGGALLPIGLITGVCLVPALFGPSNAAFTSTTANGPNTFAAKATFSSGYVTTVLADSPFLYYRHEEAIGASSLVDSSGNGHTGTFTNTTTPKGPRGRWLFDEGSGTTAGDASGVTDQAAQTTGTVAWAADSSGGSALSLDGTASAGSMTTSSAPVSTSTSFSVSAKLYLASTSGTQVAVSQRGSNGSAYTLGVSGGSFRFAVTSADTGSPTTTSVVSASAPGTGTWYRVTGVYDATAHTITLYVDYSGGVTTTGVPATWDGGVAVFGRSWNGGSYGSPFNGRIDDVHLYSYALTSSNASDLVVGNSMGRVTPGAPGALTGSASATSAAFSGTNGYNVSDSAFVNAFTGPATMEVWFRTRSTAGGTLIGFGTPSYEPGRDKVLYIDSANKLSFTVNGTTIQSATAVNDGAWHYAAASVGAAGMKLYVDAQTVVTDAGVTAGKSVNGTWWWGGGTVPVAASNIPASAYPRASLDEVATYSTQLSDARIAAHFAANT